MRHDDDKRQLRTRAAKYARVHCKRGWRKCHPKLGWLAHGPLMARVAAVATTLVLLWLCGIAIDRAKLADVCCYGFAELAAHFFGG